MKKLPFEFEDLGEQTVKNIAQPVRVYRLLLDERASESRSSPAATPAPDGEADIPSLSEGEPDAPASNPQAVEIEFWDSIKNSILASEYEAYLEQYPEGGFVALAQVRLEAIKQEAVSMRDPHDREIELSFWESVRESDNPALIQAYLEKYPNNGRCHVVETTTRSGIGARNFMRPRRPRATCLSQRRGARGVIELI
jgi:adenylate cyclase